jgi:hypothetical protein
MPLLPTGMETGSELDNGTDASGADDKSPNAGPPSTEASELARRAKPNGGTQGTETDGCLCQMSEELRVVE